MYADYVTVGSNRYGGYDSGLTYDECDLCRVRVRPRHETYRGNGTTRQRQIAGKRGNTAQGLRRASVASGQINAQAGRRERARRAGDKRRGAREKRGREIQGRAVKSGQAWQIGGRVRYDNRIKSTVSTILIDEARIGCASEKRERKMRSIDRIMVKHAIPRHERQR